MKAARELAAPLVQGENRPIVFAEKRRVRLRWRVMRCWRGAVFYTLMFATLILYMWLG